MKNKILGFLSFFLCYFLNAQNNRPQEPKLPLSYISEDVTFFNTEADSILISGTITIPNDIKNPPTAILISGSGPQDRNSFIKAFNHKPFLVLSDYLTKNGIAVLRYDDRGVGKSKGKFSTATTFDFAKDVLSAVKYLKTRKDIDTEKIGLIGHSEGGLIAPIAASKNKAIAFIILLAGTGVDGGVILQTQSRKILELGGTPKPVLDENEKLSKIIYDVIRNNKNTDSIKNEITNRLYSFKEQNPMSIISPSITPALIKKQFKILESKWLMEFIRINPANYLQNLTCPVLALNGSKDIQVLPEINLPKIEKALKEGGNKDHTIKEIENLNHLFQTATTGSIEEYKTIEETFSPLALNIIAKWINKRF